MDPYFAFMPSEWFHDLVDMGLAAPTHGPMYESEMGILDGIVILRTPTIGVEMFRLEDRQSNVTLAPLGPSNQPWYRRFADRRRG